MKKLLLTILLLLTFVSVVDSTGRHAFGQEGPLETVQLAGSYTVLARSAGSIEAWEYETGAWKQLPNGPGWSDAAGWNAPEYYSTIQTADLEGLPMTYLPTILKP